jgi:hypothetical protein
MQSLLNKLKIGLVALFVAGIAFFPFVQAQAQFGGPTVVVGDVPAAVEKAIRESLSAAFSSFAQNYMEDLIDKIEDNYKIANFLYYTDALVSGQYLQDYLDKYITNSTDQRMVLAFVPQLNCGKTPDISSQLNQQARNYLGFEPSQLRTDDPQYYQKLARMSDYLASPGGWQQRYEDLAKEAQAQAQAAAQAEIASPTGVKTGRDVRTGTISATINAIASNQQAAVQAALDLGTVHVDQLAAKIARGAIYKFINKFAFKGAVFQEQSTCISSPQIDPVIPTPDAPESPDIDQTYLKVTPEFVTVDGDGADIFKLEAKFNASWDVTQLKSAGAVKAKFNDDNKWVGLADNTERKAYFAISSPYQSFNCHKLVLTAYDANGKVVGKPLSTTRARDLIQLIRHVRTNRLLRALEARNK